MSPLDLVRDAGESADTSAPVLIVGGCGFIGTNLADRLLDSGRTVRILDNLSREGVERNLHWLRHRHGRRLEVLFGDVRERSTVRRAVAGVDVVFHLAARVARTAHLTDPVEDFDVNVRGALQVLEALRAQAEPAGLVFTSTNKVYGALHDVELTTQGRRCEPVDEFLRRTGINESRRLDFRGPEGCSKGAADQYVLDYARSFGLETVVFRMSCIYGPHQCGTAEQGWIAQFLLRAIEGRPLTIYGDGLQLRDVLYVEDLVDALILAARERKRLAGRAFNVGGGPERTTSPLELVDRIATLHGRTPELVFEGWRTGDQHYYVSDTRALEEATGWSAKTGVREGLARLDAWLKAAQGRESRVLRTLEAAR